MNVTLTYLNGSSHTFKNCGVDCYVDWEKEELTLVTYEEDYVYQTVDISRDLLSVTERDTVNGYYTVWTNPRYKASVKVDIMTAKKRSKLNNLDKYTRG